MGWGVKKTEKVQKRQGQILVGLCIDFHRQAGALYRFPRVCNSVVAYARKCCVNALAGFVSISTASASGEIETDLTYSITKEAEPQHLVW